eukprot:2731668-Amphidinium_carterae.1
MEHYTRRRRVRSGCSVRKCSACSLCKGGEDSVLSQEKVGAALDTAFQNLESVLQDDDGSHERSFWHIIMIMRRHKTITSTDKRTTRELIVVAATRLHSPGITNCNGIKILPYRFMREMGIVGV